MKGRFLALLALLVYSQWSGCLDLSIGFIAPLTGDMSDLGASCFEGARLAVDKVNAEGGLSVGGRRFKVVLVPKDDQGRPESAVTAAQELINRENVSAIVGPPQSGTAIPVSRLADKAMVPMVTPTATHADVTRGTQWVFRVCFTDDFQGVVMARFAREKLKAATAALLYDIAGTYNRSVADIFSRKFQELGGRIVATETYTTGEREFKTQLARIKSLNPDVLFLPNYLNDLRHQFDQIHELGLSTPVIGTDTMSFRDPLDIVKSNGAFYSSHFSAEITTDAVRAFSEAYRSAFQRPPTPGGALTYDAFGLIFEAAERAKGVDARTIAEGMRSIARYQGVTGTMQFDGSPDPRKSAVIISVQNGKQLFYTEIAP